MDKNSFTRAFNNHFFDFLDDILSVFPDNNEMSVARSSFDVIKRANPTAIIKAWYSFIYYPYKDVIDSGDLDFFFNKDYTTDLIYIVNSNEIIDMIDKVRRPLKDMNLANKQHSIKYLQNLTKLSVMYNDII